MNDWYSGSDDWDYPLGGIQMLGKSDDEQIRANAPRWAGKVSPGVPFEVLAHHAVDFWLCGEDLPPPDNRVTLDNEDRIHLALDEKNNIEGLKRLKHKLEGMLGDLGMHAHLLDHSIYMHKAMPIGATAHQAGTVRFGSDPATSALDVNCKAHDLDNLYVVDTSFFPSIGAVNPSLTAIANALRVGDRLIEGWAERRRLAPISRVDHPNRPSKRKRRTHGNCPVDALVIFGATGDLAKLETFPALVGLVERGVLDVPVIGVAKSGWELDEFRDYAAASLTNNGIDPKSDGGRANCSSCSTTSTATSTTRRRTKRCRTKLPPDASTLYYLEVPPPLFGRIADGIAAAGRAENARVMVEKPFGSDLAERREAERDHAQGTSREDAIYRVDHWLGLDPVDNVRVRPVRELDLRAAAQPRPRREHPDHDGRGLRRRRPRAASTTAPARSGTSSRTTCCRCWRPCLADPPDRRRPGLVADARRRG